MPTHSLLRAILHMTVTSIVFCLVNGILAYILDKFRIVTIPFFGEHDKYEDQIAGQIVSPASIKDRLKHIGGLEHIKREIVSQVLLPLKHASIFFSSLHDIHPPRGILLHGPPGTGKTMLARAIAAEANVPFFALTLATLENKWHGETSKLLAATFSLARKVQPCVLFFDEIDGMIRKRSELDASHVYSFKTEFLMHMDGINKSDEDAILVIGCTNCAASLDPAVGRRLPQKYKIELPTRGELSDILALRMRGQESFSKKEIDNIVAHMVDGLSGSDIVELVRATWVYRLNQSANKIQRELNIKSSTAADLKTWVGQVKPRHFIDVLKTKNWYRQPITKQLENKC